MFFLVVFFVLVSVMVVMVMVVFVVVLLILVVLAVVFVIIIVIIIRQKGFFNTFLIQHCFQKNGWRETDWHSHIPISQLINSTAEEAGWEKIPQTGDNPTSWKCADDFLPPIKKKGTKDMSCIAFPTSSSWGVDRPLAKIQELWMKIHKFDFHPFSWQQAPRAHTYKPWDL